MVGALRAEARAKGVDFKMKSADGARPVAMGDRRPVTSGDVMQMFKTQADALALE